MYGLVIFNTYYMSTSSKSLENESVKNIKYRNLLVAFQEFVTRLYQI